MYQFEIFTCAKEGTPSTVQKFDFQDFDNLYKGLEKWSHENRLTYDEFKTILLFIAYGGSKLEMTINNRLVHIDRKKRNKVRLAVTVTEVYDNDILFQKTSLCKNPDDALHFVKDTLETEAKERNLTFNEDWELVKEDLETGNQDDRPYRIDSPESHTCFYASSELLEI